MGDFVRYIFWGLLVVSVMLMSLQVRSYYRSDKK
jgi:hypothetical protein